MIKNDKRSGKFYWPMMGVSRQNNLESPFETCLSDCRISTSKHWLIFLNLKLRMNISSKIES